MPPLFPTEEKVEKLKDSLAESLLQNSCQSLEQSPAQYIPHRALYYFLKNINRTN